MNQFHRYHRIILYYAVLCLIDTEEVLGLNAAENKKLRSNFLIGGLQCIKDNPLTTNEIKLLRNQMIPENNKANCFVACLFKKFGIMDDMGKLSKTSAVESAKQVLKDEKLLKNVEDYIEECSSANDQPVSDDVKGCDRAKLAFACLTENAPKYGFNLMPWS